MKFVTDVQYQEALDRAKAEINADIAAGVVPETVEGFSDLHDYVDANEYGGLCEEDSPFLDMLPDGGLGQVCREGRPDVDAANAFQDELDDWIFNNRP